MSSTEAAVTSAIIKSSDLSESLQKEFVAVIERQYAENIKPQEYASNIKAELDELANGGPWNVIVGKSFAASLSHEKNGFLYVYMGGLAVLCFKTV